MTALEFHPFANLFPLMEGVDFDDLVEDVRAGGIHQPIDLYQGKILDGRNRYRAALAAGLKIGPQHIRHFRTELYGDPLAYVISQNLKRRHLDDRQRASVAGKIANLTCGRPQEDGSENPPIGGISAEKAASQLNVAPRQVERARVVHERGVSEVREALDRGELAVSVAEKIARLPEERQHVFLQDWRDELPKALPKGSRAIMGSRAEPDDSLDYFPTPPFATRALIEHVFPHLGVRELRSAWEPACGEGHIAEVLREYCPIVWASDVFDYGYGTITDFINDTTDILPDDPVDCDWIITNPPFGDRAIPFVLRALEIAPNVAMFFRSQWAVEGVERYEVIFRNHPPTLCAFFSERVPLCKGRWDPDGTTATAYCWLVWMCGKPPQPPLWIPPRCRESLTSADDRERFTAHPVRKRDGGPVAILPRSLDCQPSIGEPAVATAPHPSGERDPDGDAGLPAGSPMDDDGLLLPNFLRRDKKNRAPFMQGLPPAPGILPSGAEVAAAGQSEDGQKPAAAFSSDDE